MSSPGPSSTSPLVRAFLGLGSNIGDRRRHLRDAVDGLDGVVAVSPVYETEPVGGVDQDAFYNIVVELATDLSAEELLAVGQDLERRAGRTRIVRWGPRTLDVDLLVYGDDRIETPDLTVPHPRMIDRNFVMVPLLSIAPELAANPILTGYDPAAAIGEVREIGPL